MKSARHIVLDSVEHETSAAAVYLCNLLCRSRLYIFSIITVYICVFIPIVRLCIRIYIFIYYYLYISAVSLLKTKYA